MSNSKIEVNKMRQKTKIKITILFFLACLVLSACNSITNGNPSATQTAALAELSSGTSKGAVIAEGHVEPKDYRYLSFPMPGRVSELLVKKGDQVNSGQILARLGDIDQTQAQIAAANAEVIAAQQNLDNLQRNPELARAQAQINLVKARENQVTAQQQWDMVDVQQTKDDIEAAKSDVANAEKDLNNAKSDFEPYKDLPTDNPDRINAQNNLDFAQNTYDYAVAKRDVLVNRRDRAAAELELANQALSEAQYQSVKLANGADPQMLELARQRLEAAKSQLTAAQAAQDNLVLKAPMSGTVLDVKVIKNDLTNPSSWVILLADTSEWYVRTSDLTELDVVKIEVGQKTVSVPDALPDVSLKGIVEEISQTFTQRTGDILYDVRIKLADTDERLRWGMTVETTFSEK
jgi:HlyD family secretion protein